MDIKCHSKVYLKTHGYIIKHNITVKAAIVFVTNSKKKESDFICKKEQQL